MLDVVRKDLLLNRSTLLVNGLTFAATAVLLAMVGVDSPRALAVFAGLMIAFAPLGVVTREDKAGAMALSCSLPVTRRTIVRARYVLGLMLIVPGLLGLLGVVALVPGPVPAGELFQPSVLLVAYGLAVVIMSLMFPLTLRLGATGILVLLAGLQVLGVVLLALAQLTSSNADLQILGAIVRFFTGASATLGAPLLQTLVVGALVAVMALSYRLSVFLFERKEL